MKLISISGLALLSLAGTATAQPMPAGPPPSGPPGEAQGVLPGIMSTATGGSVDIRGDYTYDNDSDGTIIGFSLHGQYLTPQGLGGYLTIPYGYASDFFGGDNSESGVGNLEFGGMFVNHNSPTVDLYGKVGISLDTAGDAESFVVPISMLIPQAQNAFPAGLNTEWGRVAGGVRSRGPVYFGAQAGFDYPFDVEGDGFDGLFSAIGSIGFQQPGFGITGGLTYIQVVGADGNDGDNNFINFNGGLDFDISPKAKAFVHMGINLDNLDEDTVMSFGGGVRIGI